MRNILESQCHKNSYAQKDPHQPNRNKMNNVYTDTLFTALLKVICYRAKSHETTLPKEDCKTRKTKITDRDTFAAADRLCWEKLQISDVIKMLGRNMYLRDLVLCSASTERIFIWLVVDSSRVRWTFKFLQADPASISTPFSSSPLWCSS